jgi:hypothetical protein
VKRSRHLTATQLAECCVCEQRVVLDDLRGKRRTAASRRLMRSGAAAHADRHRDALRTLSAQNGDTRGFIATALVGSADPCTWPLCEWWDRWLLKRHSGPMATRLYSWLSPRFVSVMVCARRLRAVIDTVLSFVAGRTKSRRE